jgi:hypothetical protein
MTIEAKECDMNKKCKTCGGEKPLATGFYLDGRTKDGRQNECKVCSGKRRNRNYALWHPKTKKNGTVKKDKTFTEHEKDIFKLGVSVGEARCYDLIKAINIQMRANHRLFEIIKNADERDARLPIIPE